MRHNQLVWRVAGLTAMGLALTGTLGAAAFLDPTQKVDRRHCVVGQPPPETLVTLPDTSDSLVATEPRETAFATEAEIAHLNAGDRIILLDMAGKAVAEETPLIDQCDPGDDDNIARNAFKRDVLVPLAKHLKSLNANTSSDESPIIETILAVVGDPSLHAAGSKLRFLIPTDGLQNTHFASAYRRGTKFPRPEGEPLKGIAIKIVPIENARDLALQPRGLTELVDWLSMAGASVEMNKPGWLLLATTKKQRRSRP
jgi:hypothetical protein